MDTKACNLTENEIYGLIVATGSKLGWPDANINNLMERLNYLHKRLKAFGDKDEIEAKLANPTAVTTWPSN